MYTDERRRIILATVAVNGSVSVTDLARITHCSEITIRRDLRVLVDLNLVRRQRGGASALRGAMDEPTYLDKSRVSHSEKAQIAREAATLVKDGDAIMMCAGTTTEQLAVHLVRRRLVVVTNSTLVAEALANARDVEVFMLGGLLRGSIHAVVGGEAERALASLRFETVFMSGNGLTAEHGLSTPNLHVASIDRAAVRVANRVVVLADRTKIGQSSLVQTVPTDRIDLLVTDAGAPVDQVESLRGAGVEVRLAAQRS